MNITFVNDSFPAEKKCYIFCSKKSDYENYANKRILFLPALDNEAREKYRKYQNKMIDEYREANKSNHVFMSTPFACENMWQSDFFVALENYWQLTELLKTNTHIFLICKDSAWKALLRKEHQNKSKIKYNINNIKDYIKQLNLSRQALSYMWKVSLPFGYKARQSLKNVDMVIFTTWFQDTLENYIKHKSDPYFSYIPKRLEENGIRVKTFAHIDNFQGSNLKEIISYRKENIISYHCFLNLKSIVYIYLSVLFCRIKMPEPYTKFKYIINKDVLKTKWIQSVHALMVREVIKKISFYNPKVKYLHTYEGNCWEKGICMGVEHQGNRTKPVVIGYQHTSFNPAFQKLRNVSYYHPDIIYTTGTKARTVLNEVFFHKNEKLLSMIALRRANMSQNESKTKFPKSINTILVLLQGSPFDELFLRRVVEIFYNSAKNIIVREHPNFKINVPLDKSMKYSTQRDLISDIQTSDIVGHNGTTAAYDAAYYGVPCFYLNLGFAFLSDPFIGLKDNLFSNQIECKMDFDRTMQMIKKNSQDFLQYLTSFHDYYNAFFNSINEQDEKNFLNTLIG